LGCGCKFDDLLGPAVIVASRIHTRQVGLSTAVARPSLSLVPSSRTTNGTCGLIRSNASDQTAGDLITAGDAAEMLKQHGRHLRSERITSTALTDRVRLGAAARVEEVRGLPPAP